MRRSLSTIFGRFSKRYSASVFLLQRPRVMRKEPWAISWDKPIANKTCDGSKLLEVHAEPVEAAIPIKSKFKRIDSPSI